MKMHNPPHRGEVLKALCLEPLNLAVTAAARALGVSRKTLSSIPDGRAGMSPEMAVRLSIAFWSAEKGRNRLRVERLSAA
jgi:addiction module HigA family antidote